MAKVIGTKGQAHVLVSVEYKVMGVGDLETDFNRIYLFEPEKLSYHGSSGVLGVTTENV